MIGKAGKTDQFLSLAMLQSRTGTGLEHDWNRTGTALEQHWNSTGTALEQHWNSTGTALEQYACS